MSWKKQIVDAGVSESIADALIASGYSSAEKFVASIIDDEAVATLAGTLLVDKVEGLSKENASVHPVTGDLRMLRRELSGTTAAAHSGAASLNTGAASGKAGVNLVQLDRSFVTMPNLNFTLNCKAIRRQVRSTLIWCI